MANTKSAQKNIRKSAVRTEANRKVKSRLKTLVKTVKAAIVSKDAGAITTATTKVVSASDKAAKTGVIHKNKANRLKSRLAKAVKAAK
jgi:small subunit ribosomal protein S20